MMAKIAGWLLLSSGIGIILTTFYLSYNIFTAQTPVPEIFKPSSKEISSGKQPSQGLEGQVEQLLQEQIQEQLQGLIPEGGLSKMLNLGAWSVFAGIIIFGASQISSLGIKLIKN